MILSSWITPKAQKGLPSRIAGKGIFAKQPITKDEVIAVKAGHILTYDQVAKLNFPSGGSEMPITDNLMIAPVIEDEAEASMIYLNHSCEPNAGIAGNVVIVAMRDIQPEEEINFDYAMDNWAPSFGFDCNCGSETCRKRVTGNDWQLPELQKKYEGYFSWYIEQKIKAQNS